jgi:hypothetical protein
MATGKWQIDFSGLKTLPKHVKLATIAISTTENWDEIYMHLFEGRMPEKIETQIKSLTVKEHSETQWSNLLSSFGDPVLVDLEEMFKDKSGKYAHFQQFVERIHSVEGQESFPSTATAIKVYMTVCQPNYEILKPLPVVAVSAKTKFTLRYKTGEEIKRFRRDKELAKKYEKQLPALLTLLMSQFTN